MGAMALLRQMYLDADWYASGNIKNTDASLTSLNNNKNSKRTMTSQTGVHRFRPNESRSFAVHNTSLNFP